MLGIRIVLFTDGSSFQCPHIQKEGGARATLQLQCYVRNMTFLRSSPAVELSQWSKQNAIADSVVERIECHRLIWPLRDGLKWLSVGWKHLLKSKQIPERYSGKFAYYIHNVFHRNGKKESFMGSRDKTCKTRFLKNVNLSSFYPSHLLLRNSFFQIHVKRTFFLLFYMRKTCQCDLKDTPLSPIEIIRVLPVVCR